MKLSPHKYKSSTLGNTSQNISLRNPLVLATARREIFSESSTKKDKMDREEEGANMVEEMANNLMEAACSTENSSSNDRGLMEENFFEGSGRGGDFTQWEDLWVAMALLVAMAMAIMSLLGIFLLWVGIMSRLLGHDLTRDPR